MFFWVLWWWEIFDNLDAKRSLFCCYLNIPWGSAVGYWNAYFLLVASSVSNPRTWMSPFRADIAPGCFFLQFYWWVYILPCNWWINTFGCYYHVTYAFDTRINLQSIVAWMSRNSFLETGAISEVWVASTGFEPITT